MNQLKHLSSTDRVCVVTPLASNKYPVSTVTKWTRLHTAINRIHGTFSRRRILHLKQCCTITVNYIVFPHHFLPYYKVLCETKSHNVEIICSKSQKTFALQIDTFNMVEFYVSRAIPSSPWAKIRHHEQKGHVQAFTIHNRTDKKKTKKRKDSRKQATAGERNKRTTLT